MSTNSGGIDWGAVIRSPRVLIGGLGFGFTLRAALDVLPDGAKVTVSELSDALGSWNRGALADTLDRSLEDPRVEVVVGDVQRVLTKNRGAFDVVLLDIDNGPFPVTVKDNQSLYSVGGLSSVRASLKPGGRLAVWSASTHPGFNKRLAEVGFKPSVEKTGDGTHLIFIGDL